MEHERVDAGAAQGEGEDGLHHAIYIYKGEGAGKGGRGTRTTRAVTEGQSECGN